MRSSRKTPSTFPQGLTAYLRTAFPDVTPTTIQQDGRSPIIMLLTTHSVYGFAKCDEDLRADYETAYSAFKTRVVAANELKRLEPAFIFCIAADARGAEQFASSVETDVYFCRKFVVSLDDDNVGSSLASLPFMPLAPVDGAALRPASAQTFLQQAGMPAPLAKHLVVPHERSAKGIFDDCLANKHGHPATLRSDGDKGMREVALSESDVYLERVVIRNIRAYRKEQEFKLGRSITILYGPNGFGKTSFFDALDFGVTGSVGRLQRKNDAHFRMIVQHLDSQGEDAYVHIIYNKDGYQHTIRRRVAMPMAAQLDGEVVGRKHVLSTLTNTSRQAADRVDNFVSLFRATHLFSQEKQELTKNFREECELSTAVVSRMLAVEDYVSATAKADEVRDLFEDGISKYDKDLQTLETEIESETQRLASLKGAAPDLTSPAAIAAEIADINQRLRLEGLSDGNDQGDVRALRKRRADVNGAIGQIQASLERLGSLVGPISEMPALTSNRSTLDKQVAEKLIEEKDKQAQVDLANRDLDARGLTLAAAEREVAQARDAVERHKWFVTSLPDYHNANRSLKDAEEKLREELTALGVAQAQAAAIDNRITGLESEIASVAELLDVKQSQRDRLERLFTNLPAQKRRSERIKEIVAEEQRAQAALDRHNETSRQVQSQLASETTREGGLSESIARITADQKRLVRLLDEIEAHIEDGLCPVCGVDHGSREGLVRRIELRRAIDRSADFANALLDSRASVKRLREQLSELESGRSGLAGQLQDLGQERANAERGIQNFAARSNEFAVDLLSETGERNARQLLERLTDEIADLRGRLDKATQAKGDAQALRVTAVEALRQREHAVARWRQARASASATVAELQRDQRWNEKLLTASDAELQREADARIVKLNTATDARSAATDAHENAHATLDEAKRQAAALNAELTRLRAQLSIINQRLVTLRSNVAAAQLSEDADGTALAAVIADKRAALARLHALRDSLIKAELALDAATTAASHIALQNALREKEDRKKRDVARRQSYLPWRAYFQEICRLLRSQQAEAVASFTAQYGPRTSIIQRRLRSVYSFDDVEMREQGTTIVVRVKRGDDELRPVDYFSQSQQQTLLLGLFLTACSSQTWSSFSSVFMDDPVTHFDDLNTYALLDLISGLLDADSRPRQFIISTCDEKLLQLALRKFRYLGLRARFYRFDAIGRDGPVVREITGRWTEEQSQAVG